MPCTVHVHQLGVGTRTIEGGRRCQAVSSVRDGLTATGTPASSTVIAMLHLALPFGACIHARVSQQVARCYVSRQLLHVHVSARMHACMC